MICILFLCELASATRMSSSSVMTTGGECYQKVRSKNYQLMHKICKSRWNPAYSSHMSPTALQRLLSNYGFDCNVGSLEEMCAPYQKVVRCGIELEEKKGAVCDQIWDQMIDEPDQEMEPAKFEDLSRILFCKEMDAEDLRRMCDYEPIAPVDLNCQNSMMRRGEYIGSNRLDAMCKAKLGIAQDIVPMDTIVQLVKAQWGPNCETSDIERMCSPYVRTKTCFDTMDAYFSAHRHTEYPWKTVCIPAQKSWQDGPEAVNDKLEAIDWGQEAETALKACALEDVRRICQISPVYEGPSYELREQEGFSKENPGVNLDEQNGCVQAFAKKMKGQKNKYALQVYHTCFWFHGYPRKNAQGEFEEFVPFSAEGLVKMLAAGGVSCQRADLSTMCLPFAQSVKCGYEIRNRGMQASTIRRLCTLKGVDDRNMMRRLDLKQCDPKSLYTYCRWNLQQWDIK